MSRRSIAVLLGVLVVGLLGRPARAEVPRGALEAELAAADAAFREGDFDGALTRLEAIERVGARAESPPTLLARVLREKGLVLEALNRPAEALLSFVGAARHGPLVVDGGDKEVVRALVSCARSLVATGLDDATVWSRLRSQLPPGAVPPSRASETEQLDAMMRAPEWGCPRLEERNAELSSGAPPGWVYPAAASILAAGIGVGLTFAMRSVEAERERAQDRERDAELRAESSTLFIGSGVAYGLSGAALLTALLLALEPWDPGDGAGAAGILSSVSWMGEGGISVRARF